MVLKKYSSRSIVVMIAIAIMSTYRTYFQPHKPLWEFPKMGVPNIVP